MVGHSQGCLEMLEYSNKYQSRLKKLVFMGGSYKMPVNQDLIDLAENGDSDAVKLMMKWGFKDPKKLKGYVRKHKAEDMFYDEPIILEKKL